MVYIILIANVFFIIKYKWKHFNFHNHKVDFYLSIVISLLLTGVHRIELLEKGGPYLLKMGYPLAWIEKYIFGDEIFETINYFALSKAGYSIHILVINVVMLYCFVVGFRTLFSQEKITLE